VLVLGRLHARFSDDGVLALAGFAYAATMAVLVLVPLVPVAVAVLIVAGMAWLTVLSTVNATLQTFLPGWVRARGLAFYVIVVAGSQALGAAIWGVVAGQVGLTTTFVAAAVVMVGTTLAGRRWRLPDVSGLDRNPATYWPEATLAFEPDADAGPVLVTATYTVPARNSAAFVRAMSDLELSRRQTGASDWQLYRDGADPQQFLEVFEVPSWDTHLRQHGGRLTGADAAIEARAEALASTPSSVRHYFSADVVPVEDSGGDQAIQEGSSDANIGQADALGSDDQPSSGSPDTG
jgi:hypothetical protein